MKILLILILILILILGMGAWGQPTPGTPVIFGTPPGGVGAACSAPQIGYFNTSTGCLATCTGGTWQCGAGGGGGGTLAGVYSSLPSAGISGRLYFPTNVSGLLLRDNGSSWDAFFHSTPVTLPADQSTYTWFNQENCTASTTGTTILFVKTTGDHICGKYINASPPYTVIVGVYSNNQAANAHVGMVISDGTKFISHGLNIDGGLSRPVAYRWTNATTYGGVILYGPTQFTPTSTAWLKIVDNGTNRVYYFSTDGFNWIQMFSESSNTFLTPTKVGYYGDNNTDTLGGYVTVFHVSVTSSG